jgi:hypothetical protein
MNYESLKEKWDYVRQGIGLLPEIVVEKFEADFVVGYTHDSTAIEGNSLSLIETKLILEDRQYIHAIEMGQEHNPALKMA